MESISTNHVISAVHGKFSGRYATSPAFMRRIWTRFQRFRLFVYSQKGDFEDFQTYVKPKRLLPASKVQICGVPLIEQMIDYFKKQSFECLYKVRIQTSRLYGSGLTDLNAGVMLSLVDENGDSILQRISTCVSNNNVMYSTNNANSEIYHFERGGVDEFVFEGPSLGKIAAVWISIESGQWRIGDLILTIIHQQQQQDGSEESDKKLFGFQYKFELEDILIGEGTDVSMIEVRPYSVTEFSEEDIISLLAVKDTEPPPQQYSLASSISSMKEYADLKLSLLLYDALLILGGLLIDYVLAGESAAFAFLTGGIGGFLYLLLLQRSVDELPAPAPELGFSRRTNLEKQMLGGKFKVGWVLKVVLGLCVGIVVSKYVSESSSGGRVLLTQKEVIYGMIGFLMYKVAVVLAAFKPLSLGLRQNK